MSGGDCVEDGPERAGAGSQARGVDHGSHVSLAICGPHCAIAVGDLALDDGGPQRAFAGVVGRLHQSGLSIGAQN